MWFNYLLWSRQRSTSFHKMEKRSTSIKQRQFAGESRADEQKKNAFVTHIVLCGEPNRERSASHNWGKNNTSPRRATEEEKGEEEEKEANELPGAQNRPIFSWFQRDTSDLLFSLMWATLIRTHTHTHEVDAKELRNPRLGKILQQQQQ